MTQLCNLPVHNRCNAKLDIGSLSPASTRSPASTVKSPTATNYVVRNTFIEVQDDDDEIEFEEEMSRPPFQRRRGSSFWRSASEPPIAPRSPREESRSLPEDLNVAQFDPATLAAPEVALEFPRGPPGSFRTAEEESALAAAMHVGFNAGIMAAMSLKTEKQGAYHPAYAMTQPMNPTPPARNGPAPSRSNPLNAAQLGMLLGSAPTRPAKKNTSSGASDSSTTVGTTVGSGASHLEARASSPGAAAPETASCHVVWCDHRAFKDTSSTLKAQLEAEVQLPVKAHKSAENVIRLLRKKQRAQGRPPCVFVVSWANAGALLPFLNEFQQVSAKVVVLCDARGGRRQDGSEEQYSQYPFVEKVAGSWSEAVHAAGKAVAEFQVATWL